jgi:hypothetical protein
VLDGPGDPQVITGLPFSTSTYNFTGLSNYAIYTVKIAAVDHTGQEITSDTVVSMPSDIMCYLPVVQRN